MIARLHEAPTPPPSYETRNWRAYNGALERRGLLTLWFDPEMMWQAQPTGKYGRQPAHSNAAIHAFLTMKVLFRVALRQTTGFVESLPRLSGLRWLVPEFSTFSRRQKSLAMIILYRSSQGPLRLLVPSLGLQANCPNCPNCSTRSRPTNRSAASPRTAPMTPASVTMLSPDRGVHAVIPPRKSAKSLKA